MSANFYHLDVSSSYFILKPQLTNFDVTYFTQASTVRNGYGRAQLASLFKTMLHSMSKSFKTDCSPNATEAPFTIP